MRRPRPTSTRRPCITRSSSSARSRTSVGSARPGPAAAQPRASVKVFHYICRDSPHKTDMAGVSMTAAPLQARADPLRDPAAQRRRASALRRAHAGGAAGAWLVGSGGGRALQEWRARRGLRLGRIVALCCRSSTAHQNR
jgi:hypothetical protein